MEEKDFEPAGLIPRSIIRTVERFRQQLQPETIALGIQEFRISRYQVRVSVRYFFILLLLPIAINWGAKNLIIKPLVGYFWNTHGTALFLNSYQAERAFKEMRDFESQLFFEMLLFNPRSCPESETNFYEKKKVSDNTGFISLPQNSQTSCLAQQNNNFEIKPHENKDGAVLGLKQSKIQNSVFVPLQKNVKTMELLWSNKQSFFIKPSFGETNRIRNETQCKKLCSESVRVNNDKFPVSPFIQNKGSRLVTPNTLNGFQVNKEGFFYNSKFIGLESYNPDFLGRIDRNNCFEVLFQEKTYLLAEIYNQQSITALSNMFSDCIMVISIILLLRFNAPQFTILKSFLIESFYSFNDAIKCFYIILITDFLVGFHSPRGWEILMELLLRHLGLPENEEFILLFVGTFPVFLDTAFKYWIFRYLNKISPSTVATYHSMIE